MDGFHYIDDDDDVDVDVGCGAVKCSMAPIGVYRVYRGIFSHFREAPNLQCNI